MLVLGLRPTGQGRLVHHLVTAAQEGEPVRISLRELSNNQLSFPEGESVFVCENPGIVAAAADQLGCRVAPMVCTEGIPSTATLTLLDRLVACGAKLRVQCDFDWGGIKIGNMLMGLPGAAPWRFSSADYQQAVASLPSSPRLSGPQVEASWDPGLMRTMAARERAVFEENLLEPLLADLAKPAEDQDD